MCSTVVVAKSTNCSCALNPRHALEQTKQEQPITSTVMIGLGKALVWVVGVALAASVWVITGIVMVLAWAINRAWQAMMREPVAPVPAVVVAKQKPGIAVMNWPTSKHNILKVAND